MFGSSLEILALSGGKTHQCAVVNVPSFRATRQVVLVNLATLKCSLMSFQSTNAAGGASSIAPRNIVFKRNIKQTSTAIDYGTSDGMEAEI